MNNYEKYLQLREKFQEDVKALFPRSERLNVEIGIDQIHLGEFEQFCINGLLDSKECTLFGENKYLDASKYFDGVTDTFHSELF